LHEQFKNDRETIFEYLLSFVLPELKVTKTKSNSTSQDIASILCRRMIAFSGTLQNYYTYPTDFPCLFDDVANGEAVAILLDKMQTRVEISSAATPKELIQQFPLIVAVLDPDAFYEGIDNKEVITSLLKSAPENITHGLFYNRDNRIEL